ncbi:uncharacterized protein LOC117174318 isoform X1 [Belonocnema kinseyi]|uniref:uncharacterized protein LOC117174318 isoform X1 n=1 Tax=Belonocnema kinseyi TaxID=2817044 RepID=UPI00143CCD19|nr:uncharacterized protein LOC117174318 isoform X1 [Belonocnema kinseyi]
MATCAALGCRNSSKKGVKVSTFPKKPHRRDEWVRNCITFGGMNANFIPRDNSVLCEYHFEAEMWEKVRVDGKKKLKCDAVPTIFGDLVFQVKGNLIKGSVKSEHVIVEERVVQLEPLTIKVEVLPIRKLKRGQSMSESLISTNEAPRLQGDGDTEKQEISLDRGIQEPLCSTQVSNSGRNKQRRLRPSIILRSNKKKCLEIKPDLDNEHAEEPPCSKRVADSEKVQLRQSTQYSILRTIKKPLVQDTVDLVHEESFKEVSSRHLSETSNSNLQSKQIRQSTVQKGASTGIRALNQNDYSDEDLAQEEKDLSNLHEQFLNSSSITDLNVEEGLQKKCEDLQEKYNRVSKLYLKSERLRIIMKKRHKQKHRAFKEKVKKLKEQVRIAEKNPVGIRKILN